MKKLWLLIIICSAVISCKENVQTTENAIILRDVFGVELVLKDSENQPGVILSVFDISSQDEQVVFSYLKDGKTKEIKIQIN